MCEYLQQIRKRYEHELGKLKGQKEHSEDCNPVNERELRHANHIRFSRNLGSFKKNYKKEKPVYSSFAKTKMSFLQSLKNILLSFNPKIILKFATEMRK